MLIDVSTSIEIKMFTYSTVMDRIQLTISDLLLLLHKEYLKKTRESAVDIF